MAVNLTKGQKISLAKEGGGSLDRIFMGLGWDAAGSGKPGKTGFLSRIFGGGKSQAAPAIDLDASCVLFDKAKNPLETVFFNHLTGANGAIRHTGDNLTGDGDGDDEVIKVDLSKIPENVDTIVFTVNSYRGQTFNEVENAFCRLVDEKTGGEIARYAISGGGSHTAMIMAKVYRHNGEWKMAALGEPMMARTAAEMIEPIKNVI